MFSVPLWLSPAHPFGHFSQRPITRILQSVPSEANSRVVSGFLDYLKVEKGLAPLTVSAYATDIGQFSAFLEKQKRTLLNARRSEVRDFIQELFANSVDGRSVGRKLSALRHLYRYLLLDKQIEHDPTLNIDSPKQWKVLPKSLAHDEVEAMLRGPQRVSGPLAEAIVRARPRHAGGVLCRGAASVGNRRRQTGGFETRPWLCAGAGQG